MQHAISSYFYLVFILMFLILSACGIRPSSVIPPENDTHIKPANIYPNPDKNIP